MEAYLDNSATTKVHDDVKDKVVETMTVNYGNPSSMHNYGMIAENYVKEAAKIIASTLKVEPGEIVFTSGGTESNNMAIIGSALANKRAGKHIITSSVEHSSVLSTVKQLEEQGFEIDYALVDKNGVVDVESVKRLLRPDTILVSIMYVNNEVGAVMPIEELGKIIKENNKSTIFHVDAIQAYGKYQIYPKKLNVDLLSVSGHKIHGPKGSGFIYIKDKTKIKPIIYGGGQQKAMRSGTENVPAIAGIGQAVKDIYNEFNEKIDELYRLKDYFIDKMASLPKVVINSQKGTAGAPHIISVSFDGIRSEVLLHSLEEKQVYVSAGSACSSNQPKVSATLKSMGIDKKNLDSTVRYSISFDTTKEELEYAYECTKEALDKLRRYIRA